MSAKFCLIIRKLQQPKYLGPTLTLDPALKVHNTGGTPLKSGPRGGSEDGEGPSRVKERLVRRLSASSAMIAAAPVNAPSESYLNYIAHIPPEDGPQMFGMHPSVSENMSVLGE